MAKANRITATGLLLFALYYLYEASKFPMSTPTGPGAGALPVLIGVSFAVMSLLLLWENRPGKGEEGDSPDFSRWHLAGMVLAGMFVTVLLAKTLGHLLVIFLFVAFSTMVVTRVAWRRAVPASIAVAVVFYLVFEVWLGVPMIVGVFGI